MSHKSGSYITKIEINGEVMKFENPDGKGKYLRIECKSTFYKSD